MRIVIDIQGDELGSAVHPTSLTITFPPAPSEEPVAGRSVSPRAEEQGIATEDAGSAPLPGSVGSEPAVYITAPARPDAFQVTAESGKETRHAGVLDAGPAPALTAGIASADTAGVRMSVSGGGSTLDGSPEPAQAAPDDLTAIDGIGPKISSVLADSGITTYGQLAACEIETLGEILGAANVRANPETWPSQAAIAATGDMTALRAYQSDLKSR